jgi:AcrR family transcriptional regulator
VVSRTTSAGPPNIGATSDKLVTAHAVRNTEGMPTPRAYGGVPADQRREQRRAALVEAALEIIGTQGFAALTVSGLCRLTGLNDRYFNESFDSRDAIFFALIDQMVAEMAVSISAAVAATERDLNSIARAGIAAVIEYLTDDPRKARIAFIEAPTNAVVSQRRREVMDFFLDIANDHLVELLGSGHTQHPADKVRFAGVALFGVLMETTTAWLAGGLSITRDQLIDRQTELGIAMLHNTYSATATGQVLT